MKREGVECFGCCFFIYIQAMADDNTVVVLCEWILYPSGCQNATRSRDDSVRSSRLPTRCDEAKCQSIVSLFSKATSSKQTGKQPFLKMYMNGNKFPSSLPSSEAQEAVRDGAKEVDMVLHIGHLKSQDYVCLHTDIETVVRACSPTPVKVILETVFLTDEEKIAASFVAAEAGAAFVKTCTGFAGGAASPGDVALMKKTVAYKDGAVRVKASAGVRTYEKCLEVIKAGADRVGT